MADELDGIIEGGGAVETVETVETAETAPETVDNTVETVETDENTVAEGLENGEIAEETAAEASEEGETGENGEETAPDAENAPGEGLPALEFAETDAPEDILAKVTEKYDLPDEIVAGFNALIARATPEPAPAAELPVELADYGDTKAVIADLEFANTLYSKRIEGETQRQNTDKFVETLIERDPEAAQWLSYDLLRAPSTKYAGRTRWEEANIDALAKEGDTVETVLRRFDAWKQHVLEGADVPASAIPSFIPDNLKTAYRSVSQATRDALAYLDPDIDGEEIAERLDELAKVQRGIDADAQAQAAMRQQQEAAREAYETQIFDTQARFYAETRKQAAETMKAELGMTQLEAAQRIALLEQAFDQSEAGEFARAALKAEGIKFNAAQAKQLVEAVHHAAVEWTNANRRRGDDGKPLDAVQVNRAKRAVEQAGRDWKAFADDLIRQQNEKTGTQAEKKAEAAAAKKAKLAVKARPAVKTTGADAVTKPSTPAYGTPEYFEYWANRELSAAAQASRAYRE